MGRYFDGNEDYFTDAEMKDKFRDCLADCEADYDRLAAEQTEFSDNLDRAIAAGFDLSLKQSQTDQLYCARAIRLWGEPSGVCITGLGFSVMVALRDCVTKMVQHLDTEPVTVQNATGETGCVR